MSRSIELALLLALAPASAQEVGLGTLSQLRTRVEEAARDGISAQELEQLASAALQLAEEGGSRRKFWDALGVVAELCAAGPFVEARAPRARALELLALRDSDARRWSSLLAQSFLPALARLPREEWAHELAAYEQMLDERLAAAESERVRAELMHAKAFSYVFIDRRWDWLSDERRGGALELLAEVERRFGALPVPGTGEPRTETIARRARELEYELTRLGFGAPAPASAGVDLDNAALDIAAARGRIVVLDFWTSFCQPCLALVPGVRQLLDELAGQPVVYYGVCGDNDRLAGQATARRVGMSWRNLWDGPLGSEGPASKAWRVAARGWPSVFVLDAQGRIRSKLVGQEQIEAELKRVLLELLAEREQEQGQGR